MAQHAVNFEIFPLLVSNRQPTEYLRLSGILEKRYNP
jgi:hypothetical protein